jgi:hypothetical protein
MMSCRLCAGYATLSTDGRGREQFNEMTKGRDFAFEASSGLSRKHGDILNFSARSGPAF